MSSNERLRELSVHRVEHPDPDAIRAHVRESAKRILKPFLERVELQRSLNVSGKLKVR